MEFIWKAQLNTILRSTVSILPMVLNQVLIFKAGELVSETTADLFDDPWTDMFIIISAF